jgi:hypothetical protein
MKSSEIYRKAAESLATGKSTTQWSCWAVRYADNGSEFIASKREERYDRMFRPHPQCNAWGLMWGDDKKDCRILALCFMAAISESEGD